MLPLKAMLVDSWYDAYLGVVIRIQDGQIKKGIGLNDQNEATYNVDRLAILTPEMEGVKVLAMVRSE